MWYNQQPPWGQSPNVVYVPVPTNQIKEQSPLDGLERYAKIIDKAIKKEKKEEMKKAEESKKKDGDKKKPPTISYGQALLISLVTLPITIPLFVGVVVISTKVTKLLISMI